MISDFWFFLIQTYRAHCMCAACWSSESSRSVWVFSIRISSTAQHWDGPLSCSEWPPSGSRHSWRSNSRSTGSQCCIWHDWPPPLTLESSFGSRGKVLDLFQSYLTDRTQTVQIKKSKSQPHELKYGVPQGSVAGPILCNIYTTPLGQLIRRHGLTSHLHADNTQLYLTFKPSGPPSTDINILHLKIVLRMHPGMDEVEFIGTQRWQNIMTSL